MTKETCPAIGELEAWLLDNGKTQAWLARTLGKSPPSVNAWFSRASRPEPHLREAIETITGVARAQWYFPSEIKLIKNTTSHTEPSEGAA